MLFCYWGHCNWSFPLTVCWDGSAELFVKGIWSVGWLYQTLAVNVQWGFVLLLSHLWSSVNCNSRCMLSHHGHIISEFSEIRLITSSPHAHTGCVCCIWTRWRVWAGNSNGNYTLQADDGENKQTKKTTRKLLIRFSATAYILHSLNLIIKLMLYLIKNNQSINLLNNNKNNSLFTYGKGCTWSKKPWYAETNMICLAQKRKFKIFLYFQTGSSAVSSWIVLTKYSRQLLHRLPQESSSSVSNQYERAAFTASCCCTHAGGLNETYVSAFQELCYPTIIVLINRAYHT